MKIIKFEKIDSTQKKAKEIAAKKETKPWTVILAKEQTRGIGRKGNFWYSPKGGLYFSIILPKSKIEDLQTLTILAAFSVAKIIYENFKTKPFIKFPNDVYLNGKKICGVMMENIVGECGEVKFSVMGIGLNTNINNFPKDLKETATSLKIEFKKSIANEKFLSEILNELKEQLKNISE